MNDCGVIVCTEGESLNVDGSQLYAPPSQLDSFQEVAMDWLSRLFEMMPVRGRLDLRCSYGAPWRIDQGPGEANEIPYHAVLAGSAILEDPAGGRSLQLKTVDVLLLPGNSRHVMHDSSGARPKPARNRQGLNLVISENAGRGERLPIF
jgi:AraC family transcriptional regulator, activator of mtrCDE